MFLILMRKVKYNYTIAERSQCRLDSSTLYYITFNKNNKNSLHHFITLFLFFFVLNEYNIIDLKNFINIFLSLHSRKRKVIKS